MKLDIDKIIKNSNKYHYYITSTNKTIFLSSDNNKKTARKLALEKLTPNIDKLINKKVVLIKIKNIKDEFEKQSNDKISSIDEGIDNVVYLSEKFIKKNQDNIAIKMKDIVNDYVNDKLNSGFSKNIL
jgi:hypothetical protein